MLFSDLIDYLKNEKTLFNCLKKALQSFHKDRSVPWSRKTNKVHGSTECRK